MVFKELREHAKVFVLLGIASVLCVLLLALVFNTSGSSLSQLEIVRSYVNSMLPVVALVLGQRMISREYSSGTLHYIESLPVSRLSIFLVKYLTALFYLLACSLGILLLVLTLAEATENIHRQFVLILMLKTLFSVVFIWSFVFCISFLGSLRIPVCFLLFLLIYLLITYFDVELSGFGPAGLLHSEYFAFESGLWPWKNLLETLLLSMALVAVGFSIALFQQGKYAWSSAHSMGRREYVALALLLLMSMTLLQFLEQRDENTPVFEFAAANSVGHERLPLTVQFTAVTLENGAQQFLNELGSLLSTLQRTVAEQASWVLPAVNLSLELEHRSGLHRSMDARLRTEAINGVLIRSDLDVGKVEENQFLRFSVLRELFLVESAYRADFEPQAWLLDGFSWWWAYSGSKLFDGHADEARNDTISPEMLARTKALLSVVPASSLLETWSTVRERYGVETSTAVAATLVDFIHRQAPRDEFIEWIHSFLLRKLPDDSRTSLDVYQQDIKARVAGITGMRWVDVLEGWEKEISAKSEMMTIPFASLDTAVPAWRELRGTRFYGSDQVTPRARKNVLLEDYVDAFEALFVHAGDDQIGKPCFALHKQITAYDRLEDSQLLEALEIDCNAKSLMEQLSGIYGAGDRLFLAVDLLHPELAYPLRLMARRVIVR